MIISIIALSNANRENVVKYDLGLGLLDIPREILEVEITRIFSGKAVEANLAAFNSGYEAAGAEGIKERPIS